MIILSSFRFADDFSCYKVAVARWMPRGEHYPTIGFLAAEGPRGKPLRLSDYEDHQLERFAKDYADGIKERWRMVRAWLDGLDPAIDLCLCCWCPYSANSQEWFAAHGTIACHTGLIGKMIRRHRPDIELVLDADREEFLVEEWRP